MIEVEISKEMLAKARSKAQAMGTLRNSITKGQGNIAGFLGEEMIMSVYDHIVPHNTYQHDLLSGRYSIEVKCKRQKSLDPPPLHYEASIANYNPNQKADVLFFCRVSNCYKKGWIIGWIWKGEYFQKAKFHNKGDYDPSNGFIFKASCYNLRYSELKQPPTPNPSQR